MIKKDQIEKMAKDYYGYSIDSEADCKFVAEEMYNKGHRKLSEDSVVLSREEYDEIKTYKSCIPEMKKAFDKVRNAAIKETAREILQTLYNYPHEWHEMKIKELAKGYGVEVEK